VQAHTLGEVGNLGTVSLRVFSGTILPIFIEIGSYLTDKEQKISWHSFFETRCTYINNNKNQKIFISDKNFSNLEFNPTRFLVAFRLRNYGLEKF